MEIKKLTNANVYVDGTLNLLGKGRTITLPEVVAKKLTHQGLGMIGEVEHVTGLAAMMTKISWAGFYPEAIGLAGDFLKSHKLQIRAPLDIIGPGGITSRVAVVVFITGSWAKIPLGAITPSESGETEDEISTTAVKLVVGGEDILEIDIHENIWKVRGVDLLEDYRKAMGG